MSGRSFGDHIAAMEARRVEASRCLDAGENRPRDGRVLLASQYGLWDHLWLPARLILSTGHPNRRHIDAAPGRQFHDCTEIPAVEDIPAAVQRVTAASDNRASRLGALGISIESKGHKALHSRIRGVMRALWLYHLWAGDDVSQLRPRYYHPDDVRKYRPLAWAMHSDGTTLADALVYLDALCIEYAARTQKSHAGEAFLTAARRLIEVAA